MRVEVSILKVVEEVDLQTRKARRFLVLDLFGTETRVEVSDELVESLFAESALEKEVNSPQEAAYFVEDEPISPARSLHEAFMPPSPPPRARTVSADSMGNPIVSNMRRATEGVPEADEDDEVPSI